MYEIGGNIFYIEILDSTLTLFVRTLIFEGGDRNIFIKWQILCPIIVCDTDPLCLSMHIPNNYNVTFNPTMPLVAWLHCPIQ